MSYASLRNVEKLLLLFLGANRAFNYFVHLPYRPFCLVIVGGRLSPVIFLNVFVPLRSEGCPKKQLSNIYLQLCFIDSFNVLLAHAHSVFGILRRVRPSIRPCAVLRAF